MEGSTTDSRQNGPLVSIGVPLYNAEKYLRGALDSLLSQTYANIELIISDNASQDATEEICLEYAARDARVRYQRSHQNMGAVWNFRRVFELSRGEYFMWAAFDDLRAPQFVSRCVGALESEPSAVMCCTEVRLVDEQGREIDEAAFTHGIRPAGATHWERLRAIARAHYWYDFYGLIRRSALLETRLPQPVWGFDVVLLTELCLRGPVLVVPEELFTYRIFWGKRGQDAAATLGGASGAEKRSVPVSWIALVKELARSIRLAPLPAVEKFLLMLRFLAELCLRNVIMRENIRRESRGLLRGAWAEKRYRALFESAYIAGVVSSASLFDRVVTSFKYRFGRALGTELRRDA